jgi:hypothetical protein
MIIVRVELLSAVSGKTTELARMEIINDGTGTLSRGTYVGTSFIGRDSAALDRQRPSKRGRVERYPRQALHVWNLVTLMLRNMGYGT